MAVYCVMPSQFPFWDFFCCNLRDSAMAAVTQYEHSQFPFWDFFCCNITDLPDPQPDTVYIVSTLNSLFGISFVVTG
jgi:hypothetical protein